VGGISTYKTEDEIKEYFREAGEIEDFHLTVDA